MPQTPWTADVYFLIAHPDGARVLARDGQLPYLHLEKRFWLANMQPILPDVRAALGDVIVLRCLSHQSDQTTRHIWASYELEPADELEGDWIAPDQLAALPPDVANAVNTRLTEPDSPFRSPWARPGWFAEASNWISTQLEGVERIEQIKNWGISSVLRVQTRMGDCYFKVSTTRALFADEPRVTRALAERFPDDIPMPLAVHLERGWMILPDIGSNLYDTPVELNDWLTLIGRYARLQRELADKHAWLLSVGCLDRRQGVLETQVQELLKDDEALGGLGPEEVQTLRNREAELLHHCASLRASGIPDSLVHGDWHPGNIAVKDGVYRFFDWTDACLAHPFFDVPSMLDELLERLGMDAREPLLDAYLNAWTDFAPLEHLKSLLSSIQIAGYLHQAVSYQYISRGLEPSARFEVAFGIPYWLRLVMKK